MTYLNRTKMLAISGLLLVTISLFSHHAFCNDNYHLYNAVKNIYGFKGKNGKNIRIGCVEIDITSPEHLTDSARLIVHNEYQFDMNSFQALNQRFFLFSEHSESTGKKLDVWDRNNATAFLQIITDIFMTNMQALNTQNKDARTKFINMMADRSTRLSSKAYGHNHAIGWIYMNDYFSTSSKIAQHKHKYTDNGMWLQAATFFIPFISYMEARTERPIHDNIHRYFDIIVSIFSNKRFSRQVNLGEYRVNPIRAITNDFNTELLLYGHELEFLYLSFMRSLALASTQAILVNTEESFRQARTFATVISNHLSSDLHITTIRAMLYTIPGYSDISSLPNREFFTRILSDLNHTDVDDAVSLLLDSQNQASMRTIINGLLGSNIALPSDSQQALLATTPSDSRRSIDQATCTSNEAPCSGDTTTKKEPQRQEESGASNSEPLEENDENKCSQSDIDRIKKECELKLDVMQLRLEFSNQSLHNANAELERLRIENSKCNAIINNFIHENKSRCNSEDSNTNSVIENIFAQSREMHENANRDSANAQSNIQRLEEEVASLNFIVNEYVGRDIVNHDTIRNLNGDIADSDSLLAQQLSVENEQPQRVENNNGNPSATNNVGNPSNAQKEDERICCICLEPNNDDYVIIPCGHTQFCFSCISAIRGRVLRPTCPICRSNIANSIKVHFE